jgi:hypothetical protein
MQRKHMIVVGVSAAALLGAGAATTYAVSGNESTTGLDRFNTVTVDGHKALADYIVAGRIGSKYQPLPWIGRDIGAVSCPSGLKAVTGTTMNCTARASGKRIDIPVTVVKADNKSLTWKFER